MPSAPFVECGWLRSLEMVSAALKKKTQTRWVFWGKTWNLSTLVHRDSRDDWLVHWDSEFLPVVYIMQIPMIVIYLYTRVHTYICIHILYTPVFLYTHICYLYVRLLQLFQWVTKLCLTLSTGPTMMAITNKTILLVGTGWYKLDCMEKRCCVICWIFDVGISRYSWWFRKDQLATSDKSMRQMVSIYIDLLVGISFPSVSLIVMQVICCIYAFMSVMPTYLWCPQLKLWIGHVPHCLWTCAQAHLCFLVITFQQSSKYHAGNDQPTH